MAASRLAFLLLQLVLAATALVIVCAAAAQTQDTAASTGTCATSANANDEGGAVHVSTAPHTRMMIDVWGARDAHDVSPGHDPTRWWAAQKARVIFGYAKQEGVELVVFFDDTKPNVDAVQHIEQQRDATDDAGAKVLAFHVNPGHPRFLMDTDQDMFAKLTESTAAANVALERVIVVFDFDLTLSEAHTGGHDLRVLPDGGVFCGAGQRCFTDDGAVRAQLEAVERRHRKLVICSRGVAEHLTLLFEAWGFAVNERHVVYGDEDNT